MVGGAALQGVTAKHPSTQIWACGCTPLQRARLTDAARGSAEISALRAVDDVIERLRRAIDAPDILVLSVSSTETRDLAALVRDVLRAHPRIAIVAYCDQLRDSPPRIGALAAAGVHQFLFAGVNDHGAVLREVFRSARQQCAADAVMTALRDSIPSELHPMLEAGLARPSQITDVRALADALGVHRKTLFNRCAHAQFLGPAELLVWTRLALVGYLLESTGCTVETIAIELAFSSPTALRNCVKRYTGLRATDVRREGGLGLVVSRLEARVRAAASRLHLV